MGLKGLPAKFGGLQSDAEEIGSRLVKKGHEVSVYCRKWYTGKINQYKGMNLILTPTVSLRFVDVLIHSATSSIHSIFKDSEIIHLFSFGSYFFIPLLKFFGKRTVATFAAEPWKDITYNRFGRLLTRIAYLIAVKYADAITAESLPFKEMTEKKYNVRASLTPVGVYTQQPVEPNLICKDFNLQPFNYILFLGRLEKVKRVDWLIRAFREVNSSLDLVIAGDTKDRKYKNYILELSRSSKRIIFTGFVGGRLKEELFSNCLLFVLPSISEGLPTALIEAASYGKACLVSDIPAHRWMIQDFNTGFLFKTENYPDLVSKLASILDMQREFIFQIGNKAKDNVRTRFNVDKTVETLEQVYRQVTRI